MTTYHLDLGCGRNPRNPYDCDEVHGVDIGDVGLDAARFRTANLSLEPIPHADASFDSVSAFDFLEHVPRLLGSADGRGTRFPFIELMDEIHRVLKPGGRLYALTPSFPSPAAFVDPTHINVLTEGSWRYFCVHEGGVEPAARMYGFKGSFRLVRNHWGLLPEAYGASTEMPWRRRLRRAMWRRRGRLTHLIWEFERPSAAAQTDAAMG